MTSEQDITMVMEKSLLCYADYPEDLIRWINAHGVTGRYSPHLSHPIVNLMGVARLNSDNAANAIEQVKQHFDRSQQVVGWMTSDWSTPSNLETYLEQAGFKRIGTYEGRVLRDLNHQIANNPKVTVRKATDGDKNHVIRLYRDAYPLPGNIVEILMPMNKLLNLQNYLGYIEGEDDPVSIASMFYYPGTKVVALQGAATLEAFRGQGIYTSLMAKRLEDARSDGMEAAVMQADATTSGPIVTKLGFEKLCEMGFYMYPAPAENAAH